nr:hypothetical protein [uncultured Pseudodesulfovibrio sp.]
METFIPSVPLQNTSNFTQAKAQALKNLDTIPIDMPIKDIVISINKLPYCYTIQCCWGHFVNSKQPDKNNLEVVKKNDIDEKFEYRIAYLALSLENTSAGTFFLDDMKKIPSIVNSNYVQFGCAQWFLQRHINSYVLQVQPSDRAHIDSMTVPQKEALLIQSTRNVFWDTIRQRVHKLQNNPLT